MTPKDITEEFLGKKINPELFNPDEWQGDIAEGYLGWAYYSRHSPITTLNSMPRARCQSEATTGAAMRKIVDVIGSCFDSGNRQQKTGVILKLKDF